MHHHQPQQKRAPRPKGHEKNQQMVSEIERRLKFIIYFSLHSCSLPHVQYFLPWGKYIAQPPSVYP
jgi:hypothetical protein